MLRSTKARRRGPLLRLDQEQRPAEGEFGRVLDLEGRNAPPEKRMGHAGAIIAAGRGTIESNLKAFAEAGVAVADLPADVPRLIQQALS